MRYFVVSCKLSNYSTVYRGRVEDNFSHSTVTQCYVYYTVKLQVGTELCLVLIAWKSFDFPIVSLHEVFLYDTPLKLTSDHSQRVLLVILY